MQILLRFPGPTSMVLPLIALKGIGKLKLNLFKIIILWLFDSFFFFYALACVNFVR